jgi:hypothetical protein
MFVRQELPKPVDMMQQAEPAAHQQQEVVPADIAPSPSDNDAGRRDQLGPSSNNVVERDSGGADGDDVHNAPSPVPTYEGKATQQKKEDDREQRTEIVRQNGDEAAAHDTKRSSEPIRPAEAPKLTGKDYYTSPSMGQLAAWKKAQPEKLAAVEDFVVGRRHYGELCWEGQTDVRGLDLDALVDIRHGEIEVYPDGVVKPPVGQGLNKPCRVTLHYVGKSPKRRKPLSEGERKDMEDQLRSLEGTHFIKYDPESGDWQFKVCLLARVSHVNPLASNAATPTRACALAGGPFHKVRRTFCHRRRGRRKR